MSGETIYTKANSIGVTGHEFLPVNEISQHSESFARVVQSGDAIAHDMNNELAAIVAMSDLMIRTVTPESNVSAGLRRILESARHISSLAEKWQHLMREQLPSTVPPPAADAGGAPDGFHMEGRPDMNKPGHILLVDDEEVVCAATEEMLRRLGYAVSSRLSSLEAIDFYRKNWQHIGLVLLDMMMPEMDGMQVFREMRQINPAVEVMVLSGYNENSTSGQLRETGIVGYIQKPFRLSELSRKVSSVLPLPATDENLNP